MEETSCDLVQARKAFSRVGLALSAIVATATILQLFCILVPQAIWGEDNWLAASSWGKWLITFVPLYLVAIPTGLLILRKLPAQTPADNKLGAENFFAFMAIGFCLMYAGNLVGNTLAMLLSGGKAENAVEGYIMDTNPIKILFMVILAPLLEEYVCRKQIIDRTRQYGEKTAVLLSALLFGLLHQNLFQFFYAFGLGLIFAYIYVRTGRLRYPVIMHAIINFMGAVVAPWILSLVDLDAIAGMDPNAPQQELMAVLGKILPGLLIYMLYAALLLGVSIAGLVLLIIRCRKLTWQQAQNQLPQGTAAKTVYWNVGMVLYLLLCAAAIVFSLV